MVSAFLSLRYIQKGSGQSKGLLFTLGVTNVMWSYFENPLAQSLFYLNKSDFTKFLQCVT